MKSMPMFVKNAICFINVSKRPRLFGSTAMTAATSTGAHTSRLSSSDDWKMPDPGTVTGNGDGLAACTAATTFMRITGTPLATRAPERRREPQRGR
jgi:hypothetical protein